MSKLKLNVDEFRTAKIRICLDARFELGQSGHSLKDEDVASFQDAWLGALAAIIRELDLRDCNAFFARNGSPESFHETKHELSDGVTLEAVLWQAAHDRCKWEPGGRWVVT